MSEIPVDHLPEASEHSVPWQRKLAWLLVGCLLVSIVGSQVHAIFTQGVNAPIICWLIAALSVLTPCILAVWLHRIESGKTDNLSVPLGWIGLLWVSLDGVVTLIGEDAHPAVVRIDGLERGPIELVVTAQSGRHVYGRIRCVDHHATTGNGQLEMLANNCIKFVGHFVDGGRSEVTFRRSNDTAGKRRFDDGR